MVDSLRGPAGKGEMGFLDFTFKSSRVQCTGYQQNLAERVKRNDDRSLLFSSWREKYGSIGALPYSP